MDLRKALAVGIAIDALSSSLLLTGGVPAGLFVAAAIALCTGTALLVLSLLALYWARQDRTVAGQPADVDRMLDDRPRDEPTALVG